MHHGYMTAARAAAGVAVALTLAACGAAPQEPKAAEAPSSPAAQSAPQDGYGQQPGHAPPGYAAPTAAPSPASREDAASQLDQAEAELDAALGARSTGFAEPPGPSPRPAPPSQPAPPGPIEAAAKSPGDPCATACRALASMSRAADHLCGLAGEGDARCGDARARVKSATDRVHHQCPACAP
ncbi:MAG: hypothetical protein IT372_07095 [Polyangiaceae bacterium]|nr:hypothetical protein [Polyangiaceae bacterium]